MKKILIGLLLTAALFVSRAQTQNVLRALEPFYYNSVCSASTTYAFTATGCYILETTGASSFTVTLPTLASVPIGKTYNLKHLGTGAITFAANGAETIDGVTSTVVRATYQSIAVYKNAAGTAWSIQAGNVGALLLHEGSGTDTSAVPVNLDTVALSGLSPFDTIKVTAIMRVTVGSAIQPSMYDATDGLNISKTSNSAGVVAGNYFEWTIRQDPTSSTSVIGVVGETDAGNNVNFIQRGPTALAAGWTNPWTLAFRHDGITPGGAVLTWSWSVHKLAR
jgi:hypothetical protein